MAMTKHAILANYKSEISVCKAQLTALAKQLDEEIDTASPKDACQVLDFVRQQQLRAERIESSMLQVAETILPSETRSTLTNTEVMEVLSRLSYIQQGCIDKLQKEYGVTNPHSSTSGLGTQQNHTQKSKQQNGSDLRSKSKIPSRLSTLHRRLPLDAVTETDNETDATITPQSVITNNSTPPSLSNMNLSQKTTQFLQKQQFFSDTQSTYSSPQPSVLSARLGSLERHWRNQRSGVMLPPTPETNCDADVSEMDDDYDDDDDDSYSNLKSRKLSNIDRSVNREEGNTCKSMVDSAVTMDDSDAYSDVDTLDMTTLTVVAKERQNDACNNHRLRIGDKNTENVYSDDRQESFSGVGVDVTNIEYIPDELSPDLTRLSMDMNESFQSVAPTFTRKPEPRQTPVLDRYRLALDSDDPRGFCIIANPRRHQYASNNQAQRVRDAEYKDTNETETKHNNSDQYDDDLAKSLDVQSVTDENVPPHSTTTDKVEIVQNDTTEKDDTSAQLVQQIQSRTVFNVKLDQSPPFSSPNTSSALKQVNQRQPQSLSLSPFHSPLLTPPFKVMGRLTSPSIPMLNISQDEYDTAPRVVHMQVTMSQVQKAILSLNPALRARPKLSEADANLILQPLGFTDRQCKSILMSLCHWRRLLLRRDAITNSVHFEIFDSDRRNTISAL